MRRLVCSLSACAFAVLILSGASWGQSNDPNDYGPDYPPPVVYRRVPVYRPLPYYRAPAWASPGAAALGPWPWNFEFGGGPTTVTGSNGQLRGGSNFTVGGGYNFTPRSGFVLEFMNSWLGLTDQALQQNGAVDGDANIWSVTLNPIWRFRIGGPVGGYLIGGGGYYQRDYRLIEQQQVNDPVFGPLLVDEEVHQTTDAGGVNVGMGLTCNLGWGTKFFVEARYHRIFTSGDATQIIPVTIGLRW
jgi:hypothetical protein